MKKLIVMLAVAVCAAVLIAGCNEEQCRPTVSILTGSDMDSIENPIVCRIGIDNQGVGFGMELNYAGGHVERQSYGAYITAELAPTPAGTPYIGYHALLAVDDTEEKHGPILGTIIQVTPTVATVIEGQYIGMVDENEQYLAFLGVKAKF